MRWFLWIFYNLNQFDIISVCPLVVFLVAFRVLRCEAQQRPAQHESARVPSEGEDGWWLVVTLHARFNIGTVSKIAVFERRLHFSKPLQRKKNGLGSMTSYLCNLAGLESNHHFFGISMLNFGVWFGGCSCIFWPWSGETPPVGWRWMIVSMIFRKTTIFVCGGPSSSNADKPKDEALPKEATCHWYVIESLIWIITLPETNIRYPKSWLRKSDSF